MLKQVLVVEGNSDIQRVQQALEVECIATEGFNLRKPVLSRIKDAYEKRGIIILTDPDYAGERIRLFEVLRKSDDLRWAYALKHYFEHLFIAKG